MNKPLLGLTLGAGLGVIDGLTAAFYDDPEVMSMLWTAIVPGSLFKGLIAGVIIGWIARKLRNLPLGIMLGLGIAFLVTLPFAMGKTESGVSYFWEIIIPGSICGAIVGFATQTYGTATPAANPMAAHHSARVS